MSEKHIAHPVEFAIMSQDCIRGAGGLVSGIAKLREGGWERELKPESKICPKTGAFHDAQCVEKGNGCGC
jgi:hypothetical protein